MTIKIGNRELFLEYVPEIKINENSGYMQIILKVIDEKGDIYELNYFSSMDDPDLITKNIKNTIDLEG